MAHAISLLLAQTDTSGPHLNEWVVATFERQTGCHQLHQSVVAFPLPERLPDRLEDSGDAVSEHFRTLTSAMMSSLRTLSQSGPVALIETEYFGGVGTQSVVLFDRGACLIEPTTSDQTSLINRVLFVFGVQRTGTRDEFSVAGLDTIRFNTDLTEDSIWIPS